MSILSHFPYQTIRGVQRSVLVELETNWNKYDVFVVNAPTATGKSALAKTISTWQKSAAYITPTNLLVEQFKQEFPDSYVMSKKDAYFCKSYKQSCKIVQGRNQGMFCSGSCRYVQAKKEAIETERIHCNYHIYYAHDLQRPTLIVDEAHNLIPVIQDLNAQIYWKHELLYPQHVRYGSDLLEWLEKKERLTKKEQKLYDILKSPKPAYVIQRTKAYFRGKKPYGYRDCLKLIPINIARAKPVFWPSPQVQKIVLLSATISSVDIEALGLDRKRVKYIEADSPIWHEKRPINVLPLVSINYKTQEEATKEIIKYLEDVILPANKEKGLIHATYKMAEQMRASNLSKNKRLLFHDKDNKLQQLKRFQQSAEAEGKVLVASGMYEGLDLPYEKGRWQVVTKVPWGSLADPALRYKAETNPMWYQWEALKNIMQATGRICRTPNDYGKTYLLDKTFNRLYNTTKNKLIPSWWKKALVWEEK